MQYFTVFDPASLIKRSVEVPAVADVLEFIIPRSFVFPDALTRPSMVTLSAPFKSMSGAARFPEMERPVVAG